MSQTAPTALRWTDTLAVRWIQLLAGLAFFGFGVPLMIRSGLGLGPWDAFHVGLHQLTGLTVGTATILVGLAIVLGSLKLGVRPGVGTLLNMILIGLFIDLALPYVPEASGLTAGLGYYAAGILTVGFGTGMYMGAGFGNGPRDGLLVGISRRRGWPVRRVRTAVELAVLAAGWAMGGAIGIGTVIFALTIGPVMQFNLHLFGANPAPGPVTPRATTATWRGAPRRVA